MIQGNGKATVKWFVQTTGTTNETLAQKESERINKDFDALILKAELWIDAPTIAKAIIERPRTNEPPWVMPAELASVLLAGPADRAARVWHRRLSAGAENRR